MSEGDYSILYIFKYEGFTIKIYTIIYLNKELITDLF